MDITIEKRIYYVDGLCAIQILLGRVSDPPLGGYYMRGDTIAKGYVLYARLYGIGNTGCRENLNVARLLAAHS
jgi:hypothetical protein